VPRLNDFQRRYGSRGFNVLSISNEEEGKIATYSAKYKSTYGVARAFGVGQLYGDSSVPHAWLVNASGVVLWQGLPNALTDADINSALGTVVKPGATQNSAPGIGGDTWWIWLIITPAVLFAGAMGWFLWSTRDRTARYQTAIYPEQQHAPQAQVPLQQPYPQGRPQAYGQPPVPAPYRAPQPFPHQPASYPVQEPYQQTGPQESPGSKPDTRTVGKPKNISAHGATGKPGHSPIQDRPYFGKPGGDFPPFDTNHNPPRSR
jgi:hypothetical protein